jgi:thiosulfate dehydrogenase
MGKFIAGVLFGIVALTATLVFWPWQVEALSAPGGVELTLMRTMLNRAVAREAPHLSNPIPPAPENLLAGLKIYRDNCAGCHGDGAQPSPWGTTSFLPRAPQFRTEPPERPDWEIHWIVRNGIRNTAMGAWLHLLTEEQIWKVATFVSRVGSLPESVAAEWRKPPPGS